MFTHAPEHLRVKLVADAVIPGAETRIKAARITGHGRLVRFADAPEFPRVIGDGWLREHVPGMGDDQFGRLVTRLREKRWTDDELAQRVLPLRGSEERRGIA
jgi:hypothetical protein